MQREQSLHCFYICEMGGSIIISYEAKLSKERSRKIVQFRDRNSLTNRDTISYLKAIAHNCYVRTRPLRMPCYVSYVINYYTRHCFYIHYLYYSIYESFGLRSLLRQELTNKQTNIQQSSFNSIDND